MTCSFFSLSLSLSVCLSVQEGKHGSPSASYNYITLRLPGMFWIVRNLLFVLFVKCFDYDQLKEDEMGLDMCSIWEG